ncbi:MAG: LysR family transcriptional regulator [Arenicella sp.]|nr:LysR family transcriptional regulator [Arenicella sp.]
MDISALQAFIAVARHESFSKASEQLFVTQPAISKRVASLEDDLGTQLFNRIARQISLTEAGKQLLPKAQDIVHQAEDMQRYASNLNQEISGNLSVAIAHHIGLHRMPPVLREFHLQHPKVTLDIRFEDSDQAYTAVEHGDIEFAVITLPKTLPDKLTKETVWLDQLDIMVSKNHALAGQSELSLLSLTKYPCVLTSPDTETHQVIRREFQERGLSINVQMQTNNLETLKMLTVAGLGWSLLPKTMSDKSLKALDVGLDLSRELGLVIHSKRSLSNAALALRSLIERDPALR